jgi:hypothetical protein
MNASASTATTGAAVSAGSEDGSYNVDGNGAACITEKNSSSEVVQKVSSSISGLS